MTLIQSHSTSIFYKIQSSIITKKCGANIREALTSLPAPCFISPTTWPHQTLPLQQHAHNLSDAHATTGNGKNLNCVCTGRMGASGTSQKKDRAH